jgi:hypothetical protein
MVVLDELLKAGALLKLMYRGLDGKIPRFARQPDTSVTPLGSILANWMCEYLCGYSARIDLGVCAECGRFFSRQRKDNAYCSKTCQNRIAYKRRKIFEGGLLQKLEGAPGPMLQKLHPGLWAYHPRLGLGIVENVERTMRFSITVRFPQIVRTFHTRELVVDGSTFPRVEIFTATDSETLAELL